MAAASGGVAHPPRRARGLTAGGPCLAAPRRRLVTSGGPRRGVLEIRRKRAPGAPTIPKVQDEESLGARKRRGDGLVALLDLQPHPKGVRPRMLPLPLEGADSPRRQSRSSLRTLRLLPRRGERSRGIGSGLQTRSGTITRGPRPSFSGLDRGIQECTWVSLGWLERRGPRPSPWSPQGAGGRPGRRATRPWWAAPSAAGSSSATFSLLVDEPAEGAAVGAGFSGLRSLI
jgi:hypothetical protein